MTNNHDALPNPYDDEPPWLARTLNAIVDVLEAILTAIEYLASMLQRKERKSQ